MGKKSKYPKYQTGDIVVNGNTVASTTKKDKNTVSSSYNMSDSEKKIYDSIQDGLYSSLTNLFEISDATQKGWQDELDAYKKTGIESINEIYDPMVTNLKNDIASRFGNFDNSVFMDNLSNITENKADAVAELSENLLLKEDELYTTEMSNRMNYLTLLNNLNSAMNNNILNYMTASKANSESGNNHNAQAYQANNSGSFLDTMLGYGNQILDMGTKAVGIAKEYKKL